MIPARNIRAHTALDPTFWHSECPEWRALDQRLRGKIEVFQSGLQAVLLVAEARLEVSHNFEMRLGQLKCWHFAGR